MRATGLPARLVYATIAAPLSGVGGFYFGLLLLTRVIPEERGLPRFEAGWAEFVLSLLLGCAVGFTVFCWALTLPRMRRRNNAGRGWRIVFSTLLVLLATIVPAAEGIPLRYVAVLASWLAAVLTFTFIRYGLLDGRSGSRRASRGYTGVRSTR